MANLVFILGAGASATSGCPLMLNFLDVAQELYTRGKLSAQERESYLRVFKALDEMQGILAKANVDVRNIESVLAAFETGKLLGRLGNLSVDEVSEAPTHMRNLIVSVIERTTKFGDGYRTLDVPGDYARFSAMIKSAIDAKHNVSVITFNYDVAADYGLACEGFQLDYHLRNSDAIDSTRASIPMFKLHGSLNWRKCAVSDCNHIEAFKLGEVCENPSQFIQVDDARSLTTLRIHHEFFSNVNSHCMQPLIVEPLIVPPTWDKTRYYEAITPVWQGAATFLSAASHIFVCGYSFPETDVFFRYLFAVGGSGPARLLKRFHVFNPSEAVGERFRSLLGPAVADRFYFSKEKFDAAIFEVDELIYSMRQ